MSLSRQRDQLAVGQIALATIGVVWAGGTSIWVALIVAIFAAHAFIRPLPEITSRRAERGWTAGVVLALAFSLFRAIYWAQILDAGIDLLLLLAVQRLYCRQRTREHLQLLLIGALLMTIGAVINADLNYPILLVPYLVLAAMGLLVNQLAAAGERLGPSVAFAIDRHTRHHRRVLWRSAIQVAAIVAAGGLAVFLVFPRFGVGTFVRGGQSTRLASGFSHSVELGHFGTIRGDQSVVMRVVPESLAGERPPYLPIYFRGSSFDEYDDGRWTHTDSSFSAGIKRDLHTWVVTDANGVALATVDSSQGARGQIRPRAVPGYAAATQGTTMVITLEDIGTELLFVPSQPLIIEPLVTSFRASRSIRPGSDGQLLAPGRAPGAFRYRTTSRLGLPTPGELRAAGLSHPLPDPRHLGTPAALSSRFRELAQSLTRDETYRADKVGAVLEHLSDLEYTVELQPFTSAPPDPIEGFLFETQAGHCEYFASAAALLLREAGVPTRIVNGYLGADWNQVGEYYTVRQSHAHSWIEVDYGSLGWVTVDPTPASARPGPAAIASQVGQFLDALRNAYLQYIIDFGFDDQRALLRGLGVKRSQRDGSANGVLLPWVAAPLLALVLYGLRRKIGGDGRASPHVRLVRKLLRAMAAAGHARQPDESIRAFARRLQTQGVPFAPELWSFAELYELVRFGGPAFATKLPQLRAAARQLRAAIKSHAHGVGA